MATIIAVTIGIGVFITWIAGWLFCSFKAIDEYELRSKFLYGLLAFLIFAIPIGIIVNERNIEEASLPLCLVGHEAYKENTTYVMSGKVMVPIKNTSRVWICDKREE